ncbi:hypothetical protein JJL45_12780 [Tamlana sp. s12]|uniref:hypothetical protein n=1 Tax=Tamlana sp. s12 TaxID=1630406 RepID=UPI0007FFE4DB|nr:hypothetical protein [Tamlana sp. s12]OBQ56574.1 hypothetical protein VQ01_04315 [Tamlana sp. s12]QQY81789.1 hypothetical protein JJL45_12780 [Tamlana sp. s12]
MFKILFKNLLLANYSFAKRWVNKKMPERIIPATIHIFISPFTFITSGLACVILGSIVYKIKYPELVLVLIALVFGFGLQKPVKKAIHQWQIEKEYKTLSKNERWNKNTLAFLFFWIGFGVFICLGAKFMGGYLIE